MEIWQAVQFSACLVFFSFALLFVRALWFWVVSWHDVRQGWSRLKKTLFLPPSFQIHYQAKRFRIYLRDCLIFILVIASSYILYFELLQILSEVFLYFYPRLLVVLFALNLGILYVFLPFLVAAFAIVFDLSRKLILLAKIALVFTYYQLVFSFLNYNKHSLHLRF